MTGADTPNPAGQRAGDEPGIDRVTDAGPADPAPDLAEILRKAEAEVTDGGFPAAGLSGAGPAVRAA